MLGPVLRHVTDTTATVWVETDRACDVEVLGCRTRTFSVADHHYALVIIERLAPGSITPYTLLLDDEQAWPPPVSEFPPSVIRTLDGEAITILFGSCRAAAPHEPPWTLGADDDPVRGRGVDALYAYGLRMLEQDPADWPDLLLFVGDQIYADDASPGVRAKVKARRGHLEGDDRYPPLDEVADFEEYTWLYHESWRPEVERWLLSVVPSAMVFDDHDIVDDWNTSISWVRDIRGKPWWQEHVTGGLMSYWVYQHLGNLSPDEIRAERMLDTYVELGDATEALREWALQSEEFTPVPGGYRFSFFRDLGPVRVVVIDSRNGRVLDPGARRMVDDAEWAWIEEHADVECQHLVLATSVPVVVPGGIHNLERWSERVANGAWGWPGRKLGEALRRGLDLEDWSAFHASYRALIDLMVRVGTPRESPAPRSPETITILSGDVHFSYRARLDVPTAPGGEAVVSRIHQLVNSPIRNVLKARERRAMRAGMSRVGSWVTRGLRRATGARPDPERWVVEDGPYFANHVCLVTFDGATAAMVLECAEPDADGHPRLSEAARADL